MPDRVVIVTGSARGNGEAISSACRSQGWQVVGVDLEESTTASVSVRGSVDDPATWQRAVGAAREFDCGIALVNNAGVSMPAPLDPSRRHEYWTKTLSVNLYAAYSLSEALADACRDGAPCESIVNVCSLASHQGFPGNPAYLASKGGLLALTRAHAIDFGPLGIRVNSVSPGYIETLMTQKSQADPVLRRQRADRMILERWGRPVDVAFAVTFLISSDASYITGADLPVDGGWLARGL